MIILKSTKGKIQPLDVLEFGKIFRYCYTIGK